MTTTTPRSPRATAPPAVKASRRLGYRPGLDGLRAVSVAAVLLYHGGVDWIPGGFLGVEVFFVISGFLITALLIEEFRSNRRINLGQFWLRRARRLLPAMWLLLVVVCAYSVVFLPDMVAEARGAALAAFFYVTNWYLIALDQSYFAALGRPSLLRHLWSLAVEEQWYLGWPVAFWAGLRLVGGKVHRLVVPIVALAIASSAWMAFLYDPNADPSRVYYGTDTRAAGLLLGAALACGFAPWRRRNEGAARVRSAREGYVWDAAGLVALGLLGLAFCRVDEFSTWLYRGGFFQVSLISIVAIAVVVHPAARLVPGVLGLRPIVWIGVRSYGIYLWHWPIFMITRVQDLGFDGPPQLALRLVLTVVVAELSYRFVELPVRQGALPRLWRSMQVARAQRPDLAGRIGLATLVVGAVMATVVVRVASAQPPVDANGPAGPVVTNPSVTPSTVSITATSGVPTSAVTGATVAAGVAPTTPGPTTPFTGHPTVVVVGDSVARTLAKLAPASAVAQFQLVNGAVEGCSVAEGVMRSSRGQRRNLAAECKGWQTKWANAVTSSGASIALVQVGAWDVFDLQLGGQWYPFGSPEVDAHLRDQLVSGIAALKGAGAKVALLEVPCRRPVDGGGLKALPERGDDQRTAHFNQLMRQAAAADPTHVTFVTGPAAYCTDPKVATDLGNRWDGVHYDRRGAALVWDAISAQVISIARS